MPAPRSNRVAGSGTKCRLRKAKTGTTADGPMFVLTNTGLTSVRVPEAMPVLEAGSPPPIWVMGAIDTVPVSHGAPTTVMFTAAVTFATPPAPTGASGTARFATAAEHGPKRQTLVA